MISHRPSILEANAAAAFLRRHGVPVAVLTGRDVLYQAGASLQIDDASASKAAVLLAEFEASRAAMEEGWEAESRPDLSRLAASLLPDCPGCGVRLPRDAELTTCPRCGAAIDVVELIVARRGPEVLSDCCGQPPEPLGADVLDAAELVCGCGYPLRGLAPKGQCPECGEPYDKSRLILGE